MLVQSVFQIGVCRFVLNYTFFLFILRGCAASTSWEDLVELPHIANPSNNSSCMHPSESAEDEDDTTLSRLPCLIIAIAPLETVGSILHCKLQKSFAMTTDEVCSKKFAITYMQQLVVCQL